MYPLFYRHLGEVCRIKFNNIKNNYFKGLRTECASEEMRQRLSFLDEVCSYHVFVFFFVFLPSSMCFSFELFLCFHLSLVMIQFDWKFAPCNRPARITERRGTKRQSIYIVEYVFFFFGLINSISNSIDFLFIFMSFSLI